MPIPYFAAETCQRRNKQALLFHFSTASNEQHTALFKVDFRSRGLRSGFPNFYSTLFKNTKFLLPLSVGCVSPWQLQTF